MAPDGRSISQSLTHHLGVWVDYISLNNERENMFGIGWGCSGETALRQSCEGQKEYTYI